MASFDKPVTFVSLSVPTSTLPNDETGVPLSPAYFVPSESSIHAYPFDFPNFRLGQIDSLLQLADEFTKLAADSRVVLSRAGSSLLGLYDNLPDGLAHQKRSNTRTSQNTLRSFKWDETRYHSTKRLEEFPDIFRKEVTALDSDIKETFSDYSQVKTSHQKLEQSMMGNLSTRSLAKIINPSQWPFKDLANSEFMEPQIVAVPTSDVKTFTSTYTTLRRLVDPNKSSDQATSESLLPLVVPNSLLRLAEDKEFTLFVVVVMKECTTDFLAAVRTNKWIPRVYKPADCDAEAQQKKLEDLGHDVDDRFDRCVDFGQTAYKKAVSLWAHLTVLTMYVEAVLRYELPLKCQSWFIEVTPKSLKPLRKQLDIRFSHLGGHGVMRDSKGRIVEAEPAMEVSIPGVFGSNEYTPYVYYKMELPATEAA